MTTDAAPAKTARSRIEAFDAYRGMAIVLVVFAHCAALGWGYRDVEGGGFNFFWSVAMRNLALCSLPLFLFVSGYLIGKVHCDTWADYRQYLTKRVSRVVVPYLFWSVVFIGLRLVREEGFGPVDGVIALLTGQADGPYYFILMMIQFYILAPLLARMLDHRLGMLGFFVVHVAWLCAVYAVYLYIEPNLYFAVSKTPFLSWLSVFTFGMHVRRHPEGFKAVSAYAIAPVAVALYALAIGETYFWLPLEQFELAILDVRFSSLAFAFAVILLALRLRDREFPRFWQTLGAYAFGIFFIHGIVLRGFNKVYEMALPALIDVQPVFQTLVALSTLAFCVIGIAITRKVVPESITSRVLGF